jgi:hypothetical protein
MDEDEELDAREAEDLPEIAPPDDEADLIAVLREMQYVLLSHPVASQAAFGALVAEGRRFGRSREGESWKRRLEGSDLLRRARVVWEVASMKMLEENPSAVLPSAWIEAIAAVATRDQLEQFLSQLAPPATQDKHGPNR